MVDNKKKHLKKDTFSISNYKSVEIKCIIFNSIKKSILIDDEGEIDDVCKYMNLVSLNTIQKKRVS